MAFLKTSPRLSQVPVPDLLKQTTGDIGRDKKTTDQSYNIPNPNPPFVDYGNRTVVKQPASSPQQLTTNRKHKKHPRTSRLRGKLVEVCDTIGRRFKTSTEYNSTKVWRGDKCARNYLKNFLKKAFKKKHSGQKHSGQKHSEQKFEIQEEALDYILEHDMEDVVTVREPIDVAEGPVPAPASPPGYTASPAFSNVPPPMLFHPHEQAPAYQHAAEYAYAHPPSGPTATPALSSTYPHGTVTTPMAPTPYMPPVSYMPSAFSPHEVQQYSHHGANENFGQGAATHHAGGTFLTDPTSLASWVPTFSEPATFPATINTYGNMASPPTDSFPFDYNEYNPGPYYVDQRHLDQYHRDADYPMYKCD